MRTWVVLLTFSLVGCKSKSEPKPKSEPAPQQPAAAKEAAQAIAAEPRTAASVKNSFLDYTIELPASATTRAAQGNVDTKSWEFAGSRLRLDVRESSTVPSASPPKGLHYDIDNETYELKEEAKGYRSLLRRKDGSRFVLEHCRDLDPAEPPSGICCRVELASESPIADIDKVIAFGDSVCTSIAVKNRKTP